MHLLTYCMTAGVSSQAAVVYCDLTSCGSVNHWNPPFCVQPMMSYNSVTSVLWYVFCASELIVYYYYCYYYKKSVKLERLLIRVISNRKSVVQQN